MVEVKPSAGGRLKRQRECEPTYTLILRCSRAPTILGGPLGHPWRGIRVPYPPTAQRSPRSTPGETPKAVPYATDEGWLPTG